MTAVKEKPAVKKPASKPAATKPATTEKAIDKGVGLKDLAADLDKPEKAVRARIRRIKGGAQVGQGGRYRWESKSDPEYKELLKELTVKESE